MPPQSSDHAAPDPPRGELAAAVEGLEQECSLTLVPGAGAGDYVLVHAGYAISVLDEQDAQVTYELLPRIC